MTTEPASAPLRIVVGVDGSDQSKLALRWAATLADASGSSLDAVAVWHIPTTFGWGYLGFPEDAWTPEGAAEKFLAETIDEVFGDGRPPGLQLVVREGNAARVLLKESEGATMLVLGSRGHGGFSGLLLGSVSSECAEHAHCPVLVVHGEEPPAVMAHRPTVLSSKRPS